MASPPRHRGGSASRRAHRAARGQHRAPASTGTRGWRAAAFCTSVLVAVGIALDASRPPPSAPTADPTARTGAPVGALATPERAPAELSRSSPLRPGGGDDAEPEPPRSGKSAPRGAASPSGRLGAERPTWLAACPAAATQDAGSGSAVNGQIPDDRLCELPVGGLHLRADAAVAWWRLSSRYEEELGAPLCVTDAYRDLDAQSALYAAKPGLAAAPGTSNHGWGVALDLCGGAETFGTPENVWLAANAPGLGWVNPEWAQPTGSRPEPWHWELAG